MRATLRLTSWRRFGGNARHETGGVNDNPGVLARSDPLGPVIGLDVKRKFTAVDGF